MLDEFGFDRITSTEFCVSINEDQGPTNYLIPCDRSVQDALKEMLSTTVRQLEDQVGQSEGPGRLVWPRYELSEKYAAKEALIAKLASPEMTTIKSLYEEEGWTSNTSALREPTNLLYYFAVFRDRSGSKLLAIRQASQFKGIVKSRLIRLLDDSVAMVNDRVFKLDREFDFLITRDHVYILHPSSFERVAEIEEFAEKKAREKTLSLGKVIKFVDFETLADFVARHKRAARLVAALGSRSGLDRIKKSKLEIAARETQVALETIGKRIRPAKGNEIGFLELLDDRRYTTSLRPGTKEAYVASSRRRIR